MKGHNIRKIIIMKTCFQVYSIDFMPYLYKLIYIIIIIIIIIIQFGTVRTFNGFTFDVMQDNSSAKFHYV